MTQDIAAGSDWHGAIGVGLHKCQAIIPVLTPKYIASRYCLNELYTADGDKKLIFPIIYQDVDFNASDTAMGVKFVISSINWTWCRPDQDDYDTNIYKFMAGMRAKGVCVCVCGCVCVCVCVCVGGGVWVWVCGCGCVYING